MAPTSRRPTSLRPTVARRPTNSPSIEPSSSPTVESTIDSNALISYENDIHYHMGAPVMTGDVNIYNIFVGDFSSGDGPTTMELMNNAAANIGSSSWYEIVTKYYQIEEDGSRTYCTNSVSFQGSYNFNPSQTGLQYSEAQLIGDLITQMNNKVIPVDTNGVYIFMLAGDTNYPGWLTQWCGYHTGFYLADGRVIKFGVVGNPSTALDGAGAVCEAIGKGV